MAALAIATEFEAEKTMNLLVPLLSVKNLVEIPNLIQLSEENFAVVNFKHNTIIGHIVLTGGAPVFERRFHEASRCTYINVSSVVEF